jgi:hypothetical protein
LHDEFARLFQKRVDEERVGQEQTPTAHEQTGVEARQRRQKLEGVFANRHLGRQLPVLVVVIVVVVSIDGSQHDRQHLREHSVAKLKQRLKVSLQQQQQRR